MTSDERAIHYVVETWMAATKAGDIETVLDLMTDDVVFLVPGQTPFGKEAFRKASAGMESSGMQFDGESEIEEINVLGDWAYIRTKLKVTMRSGDGGAPIRRSGYTLTILRKEADGKWRLARDANLLTVKQ